ncbi:MAG: transposase [Euryarchaeota archaeon]|nr:transposase [Euryarchaeota archaeon]
MSSKAIKTITFYSPPLTRRKVRILNGLIDDYLSLANFRRIQNFIEYKARWHGIRVSYVDPAHTSSICPFCNSNLSLPSEGENKDPMGGRGETGGVWGPRAPRRPDECHKDGSSAPE